VFVDVDLEYCVQELEGKKSVLDMEASALDGKLNETNEEMAELKVLLYAKFGKSINLEK
jgi:prefoldin subunit 4